MHDFSSLLIVGCMFVMTAYGAGKFFYLLANNTALNATGGQASEADLLRTSGARGVCGQSLLPGADPGRVQSKAGVMARRASIAPECYRIDSADDST
ncbi:MAG: hypothetical protein IH604_17170 [Burkholderiales bacterium]|nr:hypothetical protein [Burkholderiales bacterium]